MREPPAFEEPKISIVIPVYNVAAYLAEAIASLQAQSETRFEAIIINDGSTDGTGAIADRLAAETLTGWPRIRVIHQNNKGQSAARNVGITVAEAPLIGFLDGDDRWGSQMVARHLDVLGKSPKVDLTFTWWRIIFESGGRESYDVKGAHRDPTYGDLICANTITLGTVVARKAAILEAGGFDETLIGFEDWDLWLRMLRRHPGAAKCIPEVLADYRQRDGQVTSDWRKMDRGWRAVIEKRREEDPELVERLWTTARARHLCYCAMLARKAGDSTSLRRLVWQAWRLNPRALMGQRGARWITQVALASVLPQPVQGAVRGLKRRVQGSVRRRYHGK